MIQVIDWLSLKLVRSWGLESRWVETSMGALHVLDGPGEGELPPVVLLHGLGARATHFRFVIRDLLPHHRRIIVPDMLGHGLSHVPERFHGGDCTDTVDEALCALVDEPVVLFGTSMGGKTAIQFASRHPDRVTRLVVSAPSGVPLDAEELRSWVGRFTVEGHQDGIRVIEQTFARTFAWPLRQVMAWGAHRQLSTFTVRNLLQRASPKDCLDPRDLERLAMPVLMLWGQEERIMEEHHLAWFRENLPAHALVERPEQYGHSPFLERPHFLADRIVEHAR